MAVEFLNDLEKKIDQLIEKIADFKDEKSRLEKDLEVKNSKINELEKENSILLAKLNECEGQQQKLDLASEKIQGIIAKLEAVAS